MTRLVLAALLLCGCRSSRLDPPQVTPSSTRPRDTDVKITGELRYAPACAVIKTHQTVEWWVDPSAPRVPINVTSLGSPRELFSPNLVPPQACDASDPARVCWRHTFERAGCYPYYDTNSGSPGRPVVDDYYGTVTFVGESGNVTKALVCVEDATTSCTGVCCNARFDCAAGFDCNQGRCVRAIDQTPSPCPAIPPA